MEKNNSDNTIMHEILMSNRIGSIAMLLAKRLDIEPIRALKLFYESCFMKVRHALPCTTKIRLFTSTATHTLLMSSSLKIPHHNE